MLSVSWNTIIDIIGVVIAAIPTGVALTKRVTLVHRLDLGPDGRSGSYRFVVLARRPVVGVSSDINVELGVPITVSGHVPGSFTARAGADNRLILTATSQLDTGSVHTVRITAHADGAALRRSDRQAGLRIARTEDWAQDNRNMRVVSAVASLVLVLGVFAVTYGIGVDPDPVAGLLGVGAALVAALPGLLASLARDRVDLLLAPVSA